MGWSRLGIFLGGVLFGTAGIRILSSRDAKKVYAHCTAAALRAKDEIVDKATILKENCADIYEEAKQINADREERDRLAEIEESTEKA